MTAMRSRNIVSRRAFSGRLVGSLTVTSLVLGGCATTGARIVTPLHEQPLGSCDQELKVEFHPNFVPGSFTATVDGEDWTARFLPAVPGKTSTAKAIAAYLSGAPVLSIDSDVRPGTNGYEPAAQRSSATFFPPRIQFSPSNFKIPQNGTALASVCVKPPKAALNVVLTPEGASPVMLNGNPAGLPITLTFLVVTTNLSCVPLNVKAITVPGSFIIRATSVGCHVGAASGVVQE
jgi:hypothetical protein